MGNFTTSSSHSLSLFNPMNQLMLTNMILMTRNGINLALTVLLLLVPAIQICSSELRILRSSFPDGFVFGTASSAFQYEGAVKDEGRGPSVWDTFSHQIGKIFDLSNADVTVDQYHRFIEDIKLMKDMGMDAYRFSISWSRIYPNGSGEINQAGIDHYNKLIDALLDHGIQPHVTLYHWDLPQALEDQYGGWLNRKITKDFGTYAETCFRHFGDRVKHWVTFNEPHTFASQGYDLGLQAPGRCSFLLCKNGNSKTEPYIVAHNTILSHGIAADIYRKKYKAKQQGLIGVAFDVIWYEPASNDTIDIEATQRAQDFQFGCSMKERVGNRLPKFSKPESTLIKGSLDFVAINHYTTYYASNNSNNFLTLNDSLADSGASTLPFDSNGKDIGERANSIWLYIVPRGIRGLMNYIKNKYGNPLIIITENGMDDPNDPLIPLEQALKDEKRIKYHNDYLANLLAAIKEDGCNVKGYFVWSLMDNWEWEVGFTSRFGLYFVDYNDNLKRYPKDSVKWFNNFLNNGK